MTAAFCSSADQFDAYLDGLLPPAEAAAFEAHAQTCSACADELALASRIRTTLRTEPTVPCPDDVYEGALARITAVQQHRPAQSSARRRRPLWRGVTAMALVLFALGLGVVVTQFNSPEPEYTAQEIETARHEVELALALLSDASRDAGLHIQRDVIGQGVVAPLQRQLGVGS
jgi:anti-sigma factor RsiW